MRIQDLRRELEDVRESLRENRVAPALERIEQILDGLDDRLLTTTQAKEILGLGSVNTVKLLVQRAGIRTERRGNRMLIPLSEIERLQNSSIVRGLQTSDVLHDQSAELGAPEGLTQEDFEALVEEQPRVPPWEDERISIRA